jgi:V/A-type H+-transporting ATPase subunit E
MSEELQHLIDRFQKEAVDKADGQAADIVAKARKEAASIVKEAEDKAAELLEKADRDAQSYTERSTRTLEQAARDLLITVGKGVENIISDIVAEDVKDAMDIEVLKQMLVKLADASTQNEDEGEINILLSPDDQKQLLDYFTERYREKMAGGIELKADNEIFKGFKISFVKEHVYHEFTYEAIAEAVSNFLRPHLAEIVHRVAEGDDKKK